VHTDSTIGNRPIPSSRRARRCADGEPIIMQVLGLPAVRN